MASRAVSAPCWLARCHFAVKGLTWVFSTSQAICVEVPHSRKDLGSLCAHVARKKGIDAIKGCLLNSIKIPEPLCSNS